MAALIEERDQFYSIARESWDALNHARRSLRLSRKVSRSLKGHRGVGLDDVQAPIGTQEVWAAGVTYYRSRDARMQESKSSGGGDFYDRVYGADRPELFFKATPHRVAGPNSKVAIRDDATWSVPEPELTLLITPQRTHRRLHDRQRHELARYRRREPFVFAAGQSV